MPQREQQSPGPRRSPVRWLAALAIASLFAWGPDAPRAESATYRLEGGNADETYKEIERLHKAKDIGAAADLVAAAIKFTDAHLAVAAGEALRDMDEDKLSEELFKSKAFQKQLKKAKKLKDAEQQRSLARLLGAWGHPEIDPLLAHLAGGRREPEVQAEALHMTRSLKPSRKGEKPRYPKVRAAIRAALEKGRSDEILCAACIGAAHFNDTIFVPTLVNMVRKERGAYPGLFAVWALRQMRYDGGISTFIHVAKNRPKRHTMQANLKAIAELATPGDVEDLLSLSRSPQQDMRDAAVLALGRLPWRSEKGRLPSSPNNNTEVVTGEQPAPKGEKVLPEPELKVPDAVIERMIQIVREDRSWEVRDAARQALLRWGTRAKRHVVASMPELVTASQADVAHTAIELCGRFGVASAYDDLFKIALHEERDRAMRMYAYRALEGVDPKQAVEDFSKLFRPRKNAKSTEISAVRALGYIRTPESFNALLDLVTSVQPFSEPMLREAEFALERLTGHRFGRVRDTWDNWYAKAANPFYPRLTKFDRAHNRREAISRGLYGLTQATERAVEDGLGWLERQQHPIGLWDGNEKGFGGVVQCEPAYTGLSLLAFLGAGYQGRRGKYSETIRRATDFLCATQYYDGGFPVTGGGDDSWIYAYLIGMAVWGVNEAYGLSGDDRYMEPAQWGIDYLVRTQTPGAGWRYGPRYVQSDTSCTSWVLMATKMADLIGLDVAQKSWDGVDDWLERCASDITGEIEKLEDMSTDYDHEVGIQRRFEAFTSYFKLGESDARGSQKISMTAVGMVCRFFMGYKRSHPFQIGSANFLLEYLPEWMAGMGKDQNVAWYHYYWYYGTLSMHQMGGKYWRAWNQKVKRMYPKKQRKSPEKLRGSWDPDPTVLNGGRIFSTAMSILSLETYYRFSPLLGEAGSEDAPGEKDAGAPKDK